MIKRFVPPFFLISFFLCSVSAGTSLSPDEVEKKAVQLFEQFQSVPHVRVTPTEEDRFVIELTFSIGDQWGREGYARDLAKTAIRRMFKSNLPLAQGIVRVRCTRFEAIHLAIGINQARQMSWADSATTSAFFDSLRSSFQWGKRPEDRTYLIEHSPIVKPSPGAPLSPES